MHILLTRPLEDCSDMILKFKSLGHKVSHLPLLKIVPVNHTQINFSNFNSLTNFSSKTLLCSVL